MTEAADTAFENYLAHLGEIQVLNENLDGKFEFEQWQTRCQVYIAYYECLNLFPACVQDQNDANAVPVEVRESSVI